MSRFLSPAKVNLFLNVLRKRKDGYHEIDTLFERIDLCDEIVLKSVPHGIGVRCSTGPQGSDNLAYRAAKILQDTFKIKKGVEIAIRKKIPMGAGLGGGSSNAATVLLGLKHLWKIRCSQKKLMALGAKIGSDVPFFILQTPFAHATGRGEILRKIKNPPPKIWHVLVKPNFSISTKMAYVLWSRRGRSRACPPRAATRAAPTELTFPGTRVRMTLFNSLEHVLNKRLTEILKIKKSLMNTGALGALMSGSGSVVFGIFASKALAQKVERNLRKKNKSWQVFVASTF